MQTSRCFAIGDIHGHLDALDALLELLRSEAGFNDSDTLIFLGDYVDRGAESGASARDDPAQNHRWGSYSFLTPPCTR